MTTRRLGDLLSCPWGAHAETASREQGLACGVCREYGVCSADEIHHELGGMNLHAQSLMDSTASQMNVNNTFEKLQDLEPVGIVHVLWTGSQREVEAEMF